MKRIIFGVVIGALASAGMSGAAQSTNSTGSGPAAGAVIQIDDVDRFYKVYDAAGGHPTADQSPARLYRSRFGRASTLRQDAKHFREYDRQDLGRAS